MLQHPPKQCVKTVPLIKVFPNSSKTINALTSNVSNNVATTSEIVFVKDVATIKNHHVFGKNSDSLLPEDKKNRFVPICHYCNKLGHICPRCFKYINTFRMNRMVQSSYKPRTIPKHKIDLKK